MREIRRVTPDSNTYKASTVVWRKIKIFYNVCNLMVITMARVLHRELASITYLT